MADISDVADAIAQLVGATLYPGAQSGNSIAGLPVLSQQGWPDSKSLETFVAAGQAQVTVFARPGERNTTRSETRWEERAAPATTYTLTQAGQTITVGGAAPGTYFAQNLAAFVNGKPYVAQALAGQTPAQLAAALRALIVADVAGTTVLGAVITLPATARIGDLRIGSTATALREVRRQARQLQVTIWAPTPAARDAIAKAIDPVLADTPRLTLADGTTANLTYFGSPVTDADQKQGVYRRDLIYTAEFGTVRSMTAAQMVAGVTELDDSAGHPIATAYN